jgi:hypothetical protein
MNYSDMRLMVLLMHDATDSSLLDLQQDIRDGVILAQPHVAEFLDAEIRERGI